MKAASISSIEVDRPGNKLRVTIRTARPGIIIGRKGAEIEKLKMVKLAKKTGREVFIDIQEVHKPELDAQLVSGIDRSAARETRSKISAARCAKPSTRRWRFGCKGIKVRVSGRLNGAEIARTEWYLQGQLPLHTLRADIDYGFSEAHTTYGVIGVKCWTYRGEILEACVARKAMRNKPEPRRRGSRDRDRGGDRGDRRPPPRDGGRDGGAARPPRPMGSPAAGGAAGQHDAPKIAPIMPPLSAPVPAWKAEGPKPEAAKPEDA